MDRLFLNNVSFGTISWISWAESHRKLSIPIICIRRKSVVPFLLLIKFDIPKHFLYKTCFWWYFSLDFLSTCSTLQKPISSTTRVVFYGTQTFHGLLWNRFITPLVSPFMNHSFFFPGTLKSVWIPFEIKNLRTFIYFEGVISTVAYNVLAQLYTRKSRHTLSSFRSVPAFKSQEECSLSPCVLHTLWKEAVCQRIHFRFFEVPQCTIDIGTVVATIHTVY